MGEQPYLQIGGDEGFISRLLKSIRGAVDGEEPGGEPLTSKAVTKSEKDGDHPSGHYLVVEDSQKPSTWHLRVRNVSGEVDHNLMGAAWAALHGGYRGNKYQGPDKDKALSKLRGLYKSEGMDLPESKAQSGLGLVKHKSGKWLWFARYSNKYLDDDYPREIIAEESHLNFVKEVNEGNLDYPELWLYHIPGTTWGKAQWVGYDNGFAMAAGYIYPEYEELAEAMANKSGLLLSHGMDPDSIVRDEQNPNIILRHATAEISLLPASRAANKLTGFVILEEDNMNKGLSDAERQALIDMGVPEKWIAGKEEENETLKNIADALGIPSKAKALEDEDADVTAGDSVEEEEETGDEPQEEQETAALDDETVDAIIDSIKALDEKINEVANYVKSLGETQDKLVGESTKAARMGILKSVIGDEETYVDGRSSLGKAGPKETKSNSDKPFFFQQEGWTRGS